MYNHGIRGIRGEHGTRGNHGSRGDQLVIDSYSKGNLLKYSNYHYIGKKSME